MELTARYMEDTQAEKAASEKRRTETKKTASTKRQPSVKKTYVDLLFPHTINYKSKKARKGKKGTVSDQKSQQASEEEVIGEEVSKGEEHKKTERRFEYFRILLIYEFFAKQVTRDESCIRESREITNWIQVDSGVMTFHNTFRTKS